MWSSSLIRLTRALAGQFLENDRGIRYYTVLCSSITRKPLYLITPQLMDISLGVVVQLCISFMSELPFVVYESQENLPGLVPRVSQWNSVALPFEVCLSRRGWEPS